MITEDYCSFKVARLLKEKGFNEPCRAVYEEKVLRVNTLCDYLNSELSSYVCTPTLQMTMKWLREVHNIFIEISVDEMLKDERYQWALYDNNTKEIRPYAGWGGSYEEAVEAAIKYCLENLI